MSSGQVPPWLSEHLLTFGLLVSNLARVRGFMVAVFCYLLIFVQFVIFLPLESVFPNGFLIPHRIWFVNKCRVFLLSTPGWGWHKLVLVPWLFHRSEGIVFQRTQIRCCSVCVLCWWLNVFTIIMWTVHSTVTTFNNLLVVMTWSTSNITSGCNKGFWTRFPYLSFRPKYCSS